MDQARRLQSLGFEVETAADGEAAVLAASRDGGIDLVLMDINLGRGIDGTEAARLILAQRDVPIVFLTSHSEREMVEKVRGITRYGYVIKNSGDFVLESSIEMAFELFHAHENAKTEESRLRSLVRAIPDLVWLKDLDGYYIRCNQMFERLYGAKEAEIVGKTDFDFVDADRARFFRKRDRMALEADAPTPNEEWVTFADSGERRLLETIKTPLKDEAGNCIGILGIARDITGHQVIAETLVKDAEASVERENSIKEKLRAIIAPEGDMASLELGDIVDADRLQRIMRDFNALTGMNVGIIDRKGRYVVSVGSQDICRDFHRANEASCRLCGESDAEFAKHAEPGSYREYHCKNGLWDVGTPIYIEGAYLGNIKTGQFFYDDETPDRESFARRALDFGYDEKAYLEALDRVPRWSRARVQATMRFYTELADIIGHLSFSNLQLGRNIAERERLLAEAKESERRFARMAEEKMILLRELKHRVKNSLAIVSSLLSINKDRIDDEQAAGVFVEAITRIKSVSAIYDQLNESEELERIDIDGYIRKLIDLIGKTYTVGSDRIAFALDLENKAIELKTAVPIGLIINELVTNAIKYAYPEGRRGEVRISFRNEEGSSVLEVSDDGPGLPSGFDPKQAESLGMRITTMLADQIGAELSFSGERGTTATLVLKD